MTQGSEGNGNTPPPARLPSSPGMPRPFVPRPAPTTETAGTTPAPAALPSSPANLAPLPLVPRPGARPTGAAPVPAPPPPIPLVHRAAATVRSIPAYTPPASATGTQLGTGEDPERKPPSEAPSEPPSSRGMRSVTRLGDLLVAMGLAEPQVVESAARLATQERRKLGEVLRQSGRISEADLYRALARQRGLPFVTYDVVLTRTDRATVRAFTGTLDDQPALPIAFGDGKLTVVVTDPENVNQEALLEGTGADSVEMLLVSATDFDRLRTWIDPSEATAEVSGSQMPPPPNERSLLMPGPLSRAPTPDDPTALFDQLLKHAVAEGASDLHLESATDHLRVRIRVDGTLRELARLPLLRAEIAEVVTAVRREAGMDATRTHGATTRQVGGADGTTRWRLVVGLHETSRGESVRIRLRAADGRIRTIAELQCPAEVARDYARALDGRTGLLLITGPVGTGRTTTLYAGIQRLAMDASRKVVTVEETVDAELEGIEQIVSPTGDAMAARIRALSSQDVDVLAVGSIRDPATALEVVRFAQTGRLVLASTDASDATDAVQRLLDWNVPATALASELRLVYWQQLVRKLCDACRFESGGDPKIVRELFPEGLTLGFPSWRGKGCEKCDGTGVTGRVPAVEFLRVTPQLRDAVARRLPPDPLRRVAIQSGMRSLRDSLLELVTAGLVPVSEIPATLPAERMAGEASTVF